jgi:hypothetical protein
VLEIREFQSDSEGAMKKKVVFLQTDVRKLSGFLSDFEI